MEKERFEYLLKNQGKWAEEYRKQEAEKANIRRILNRKWVSKSFRSNDWIKEELIKSLKVGELELIENLVGKGFDRLDFLELDHSIRLSNK